MRVLAPVVLLCGILPAAAQQPEPFGLRAIVEPTHPIIRREWRTMPQKFVADAALLDACRAEPERCTQSSQKALELIESLRGLSSYALLKRVNDRVNAMIEYVSDLEQWGRTEPGNKSEVWTGPLAALDSGKGDCEEYANLKYFILWQAGIPLAKLRLVVVEYQHTSITEMHIMLAVERKNDWLMLDNAADRVAAEMKPLYLLQPYNLTVQPALATALPAH